MPLATLYVLLLPAVGYICVRKTNELRRKLKPISGLELTYHSAALGALFFSIAFVLVRFATFFCDFTPNPIVADFIAHFFSGIDEILVCFILAGVFSFLNSLRLKSDDSVWDGDANTGRIWGELVNKNVVIFLDNGKCYIGRLIEAEVSERVPVSEKLVTIWVLVSGFRNERGTVDWNTKYTDPLVHHFQMDSIVNFSRYMHRATFKIEEKAKRKEKA